MVVSPPYACQFVFVTKDMAVLRAVSQRTARQMLRIERQDALDELQEKERDEAHAVEEEKGQGIPFPGHLLALVYAADSGRRARSSGTRHAAQDVPPSFEDRRHVAAEERREEQQYREVI